MSNTREKTIPPFRARIAEIRQREGWTQSEMADRLGVTQSLVSLWERGKGSPTVEQFLVLAGEFGYDLGWLLTGTPLQRTAVEDLPQPVVTFSRAGGEPQGMNTADYLAVPLLADAVAAGEPMINSPPGCLPSV